MLTVEGDGVDHINIYSKARTELGRFLSNFWACSNGSMIDTKDGAFRTIEGYWYWLGCRDERLRLTAGFESKKLGRVLGARDWIDDKDFKNRILYAITIKILSNSVMKERFKDSTLPLVHYYAYRNKIVEVREGLWILVFLEQLREQLKSE